MGERRSETRSLPLIFFLIGVALLTMTRHDLPATLSAMLAGEFQADGQSCLLCQRSTAWLFHLLRLVLTGISQLFFLGPEAGPFALHSPWGHADVARSNEVAIGFVAYFGHLVILALPTFLFVCALVVRVRDRMIYVGLILCTLGGWPALLVNALLSLGNAAMSWPVAYYNFAHPILHYDWAAIGFVHLIGLAILRNWSRKPFLVLLLAVLGQIMMDNLGLVTLVALGLAGLSDGGWRSAVANAVAATLGTAAVLLVIFLFGRFQMESAGFERASQAGGLIDGVMSWLGYFWSVQGRYNFLWFNVTVANFVSLAVLPALGGLLFGLVLGDRELPIDRRVALRAVGFPLIGFGLTLLIGLFKSGFGSDMGRQVLPFVALLIPFGMLLAKSARSG